MHDYILANIKMIMRVMYLRTSRSIWSGKIFNNPHYFLSVSSVVVIHSMDQAYTEKTVIMWYSVVYCI